MRISYTDEQRRMAVVTYRRVGSYARTIRVLGYPSRHVLHDWVRGYRLGRKPRLPAGPPRHYSWEFKSAAVRRVLDGEAIKYVGEDLHMTTYVLLYKWVQNWRDHGDRGLMSKQEKAQADGFPTRAALERALPDDMAELKRLAAELMVERAMLERELELVKKDVGVIPGQLSNLCKTRIVEELRQRFPLLLLLRLAKLRPSSYQYCRGVLRRPPRHTELRLQIGRLARESSYTYGAPRIWLSLRREGVRVSEKVVRRVMKEERVPVFYARRKRRYSSYEGEITPAPVDLVRRNFHTNAPNRLWLTDITEFAAPDAKVYLSPMVDCFDGKVVAWRTSRSPSKQLTQGMLEDAISTLPRRSRAALRTKNDGHVLKVHTDRGGHYRGGQWIETMNTAALTRSMSRKGNSGDNAACEGFFGRMKTEMFYGRTWASAAEVEYAIGRYIDFYNNDRIKTTLGGLTIREYREAQDAKPSRKQS